MNSTNSVYLIHFAQDNANLLISRHHIHTIKKNYCKKTYLFHYWYSHAFNYYGCSVEIGEGYSCRYYKHYYYYILLFLLLVVVEHIHVFCISHSKHSILPLALFNNYQCFFTFVAFFNLVTPSSTMPPPAPGGACPPATGPTAPRTSSRSTITTALASQGKRRGDEQWNMRYNPLVPEANWNSFFLHTPQRTEISSLSWKSR